MAKSAISSCGGDVKEGIGVQLVVECFECEVGGAFVGVQFGEFTMAEEVLDGVGHGGVLLIRSVE